MRHKKSHNHRAGWSSWQILFVLVSLVAVAGFGMMVSQQLLLNNARVMGKNLVTSYSNDEENQLDEYDRILTMAMYYLEDLDAQGADNAEVAEWLVDFFEKSTSLIQSNSLELYVARENLIISSSGTRTENQNYQDQSWYQQAMAAEGRVIFTDAYSSAAYDGRMVVTIAISAAGSDSAVAFDVPLEHFFTNHTAQDLPEGGAYYVLDSQGSLLYYSVPFEAVEEDIQVYTSDLFSRIKRGELDGLPQLTAFARRLEEAAVDTIESGVMTGDLAGLWEGEAPARKVTGLEFLRAIRARL